MRTDRSRLERVHRLLASAVEELVTGERWQAMLAAAARFHRYSTGAVGIFERSDRVVGAARRLTTRLDRQLGVGLAPDAATAPVIDLGARLAAIGRGPEPPPLSVA